MDKPLILEIREFTEDLAQVINKYSSSIPFSIMSDKINDVLRLVNKQAEIQYKAVYEKYNNEVKANEQNN